MTSHVLFFFGGGGRLCRFAARDSTRRREEGGRREIKVYNRATEMASPQCPSVFLEGTNGGQNRRAVQKVFFLLRALLFVYVGGGVLRSFFKGG